MESPKSDAARKEGISQLPAACQEGQQTAAQESVVHAFEGVRQRANAGNQRAREFLRKYLDSHPELWSRFGNMARHAELAVIKAASGGEWLTGEAVKRESARMRERLAGPSPTSLEQMAVERVVLTWTQLQHVEMCFMKAQQDLGWAKYWLKRQQQADKLHREAVKSLLLIRELLPVPAPEPTSTTANNTTVWHDNADMDALAEKLMAEGSPIADGCPVNRIAGLPGYADSRSETPADRAPRLNGHHHRLEEVLGIGGT